MSTKSVSLVSTLLAASAICLTAAGAQAEMAISAYGGVQSAPHSDVTVTGAGAQTFTAGWEGKSFAMPPYYGFRGTWWMDNLGQPNLGLAIDYSHAKVYSDSATLATSGYSHFEFTDGLNLLTVNAFYRHPIQGSKFTPYIGAGAGITIPHVEVDRPGLGTTREFQYGGPTVQLTAGVSYQITDNWSAFAEYKGNYSWVDVDIDSGSKLSTNIITNAVNVGVTYHW